jgi:hypothetical protein
MKRVARFGKSMLPKKEKPKSTFSKKPRLYRKMKMPIMKMDIIILQKDLEDDKPQPSIL